MAEISLDAFLPLPPLAEDLQFHSEIIIDRFGNFSGSLFCSLAAPPPPELFAPLRKTKIWTEEEKKLALASLAEHGYDWERMRQAVGPSKTYQQCKCFGNRMRRLDKAPVRRSKELYSRVWTREEEAKFAQAQDRFGKSRWTDICRFIGTKSYHQCKFYGQSRGKRASA